MLCAAVGAIATCHAAHLPDWAQAIASASMPAEPPDSNDSFQVLSVERTMTVHPDGRVTVEDRIAKRALKAGADDVGFGTMALGSSWQLESSRAWHLPPGEKVKKSRRSSMFEFNDTSMFLSDSRTRGVVVPDIVDGSLVFFEFRAEWTPYALSFDHNFATGEPTVRSKLVVSVPPGWSVASDWIGAPGPGPDPVTVGAVTTWEVTDILPPKPEPLSGDAPDGCGILAVAVVPTTDLAPGAPAVFRSWSDVSVWMTRLIEDRAGAGQLLDSGWPAAGNGSADPMEQIEASARAVRDSVRYVAKEVGIDGYRPRPAVETATTLWGDCKDKSVLLAATLADRGVTALPLLVNAASEFTVSESVPTLDAFNHMVTAVVLGELEVPPYLAGAVIEDSTHGRLLVIDPTDDDTSPGSVPRTILGHRALLVDGPRGALITVPGTRPEDHRLEQWLTVTIGEDGSVRFARERRMTGEPAALYRAGLRSEGVTWRDAVERTIREQWIGADVDSFDVVEESSEGAAIERISWTVDSLAGGSGGRSIPLFAHIAEAVPRVSLRRRRYPVVYDFPRIERSEVHVVGLPADAVTPDARATEGNGWRLETRVQRSPDALDASFEMRLEQRRFDTDSLPDLRRLYGALATVSRAAVVVPTAP
jgi:transglutaminase-like putative cysteine protease